MPCLQGEYGEPEGTGEKCTLSAPQKRNQRIRGQANYVLRADMRVTQKRGTKGSLRWIQDLVNLYPEILNAKLQEQLPFNADFIEWVSPIEADE